MEALPPNLRQGELCPLEPHVGGCMSFCLNRNFKRLSVFIGP